MTVLLALIGRGAFTAQVAIAVMRPLVVLPEVIAGFGFAAEMNGALITRIASLSTLVAYSLVASDLPNCHSRTPSRSLS